MLDHLEEILDVTPTDLGELLEAMDTLEADQ